MPQRKHTAVEFAVGGSGGKPGRCFASVTGPQADDTWAAAIALGTTRSTANVCPGRAEEMAAPNAELVRAPCSHGPMGRLFQEKSRRNGSQSRGYSAGFTFAELLVSVGVLVLLTLLATQLLNSAATIITLGHRQMDADSQARELFDRMTIDFAQMFRSPDVDYYLKSSTTAADCTLCTRQRGNDQIAFYSTVPGWSALTGAQQSPVSIIGYRINVSGTTLSNRLERLGEAMVWNGATSETRSDGRPASVVFWAPLNPWANVTNSPFDIIGEGVFRFEYYYLLKNGALSSTPWYATSSVRGLQDVSAIIVDIAAIDLKSRVLLSNSDVTGLAEDLADYNGESLGGLLAGWRAVLDENTTLPRPALSSVRLYERCFYLSPASL